MTEYWVSQGNKWCEYCKIFLSNNKATWITHENGERHKAAVAAKLAGIRKKTAKDDAKLAQAKVALEEIEQKAAIQYARDRAKMDAEEQLQRTKEVGDRIARAPPPGKAPEPAIPSPPQQAATSAGTATSAGSANEWVQTEGSSYLFNKASGYHYDPNSGLYYTELLVLIGIRGGVGISGKWTTQQEALHASQQPAQKSTSGAGVTSIIANNGIVKARQQQILQRPRHVVVQQNQVQSHKGVKGVKGVASSIAVVKRKREDENGPKVVSKEEVAALEAREAAKKRQIAREQKHLGLYSTF